MKELRAFVDADSICYSAGYCEHDAEMRMAVDMYVRRIAEATGAQRLFFIVENPFEKRNYRNDVAVTKPYKGNRRDKTKPPFVKDAKLYMRQRYGAIFVDDQESEDLMTIMAQEWGLEWSVKCCIDKDCLQHPGTYYDYRTQKTFEIDEEYARFALWRQILTGDSVDNIPGLKGIGPKKAEAILAEGPTYLKAVVRAYKAHGHPYKYMLEQSRLIYIKKERGEMFTPCSKYEYEEWK